MATHVRDVMTEGALCWGDDSVLVAAHKLAELQVGSVPICANDNRVKGILTDRDIVVKVLARDLDPATVTATGINWSGSSARQTWLRRRRNDVRAS